MESIAAELPRETREAYERYLKIPVAERGAIKNKIDDYVSTVLNASGENEFLDYPTAQRISLSLRKLLEVCSDDQLVHVQAATLYFISTDDASPDLESILGFDDDAQVVNAVCRVLGHPELEVTL
jgi:hypothetical protein